MNKTIAKIGVTGLVLFGVTECHMITTPPVIADAIHETQTLEVPRHFGILDRISIEAAHVRFRVVSIEEDVYPWLNPTNTAKQLSESDLKSVLKQVGFEGYALRMAQAIVALESTRRPFAHNPNAHTGDNSYGLFQINMFRGLEAQRLKQYDLEKNEDLFDPLTNATIAYKMSNSGVNWGAWTTYKKAKAIVGQFSS
jgi:hypothetical protein